MKIRDPEGVGPWLWILIGFGVGLSVEKFIPTRAPSTPVIARSPSPAMIELQFRTPNSVYKVKCAEAGGEEACRLDSELRRY